MISRGAIFGPSNSYAAFVQRFQPTVPFELEVSFAGPKPSPEETDYVDRTRWNPVELPDTLTGQSWATQEMRVRTIKTILRSALGDQTNQLELTDRRLTHFRELLPGSLVAPDFGQEPGPFPPVRESRVRARLTFEEGTFSGVD